MPRAALIERGRVVLGHDECRAPGRVAAQRRGQGEGGEGGGDEGACVIAAEPVKELVVLGLAQQRGQVVQHMCL